MEKSQYDWLVNLHKDGHLLQPNQPASSFVKLVLNGIPEEVVGKVIPWDDTRIQ